MNANAALSIYDVKRSEVLPRNRHMDEATVTCGMEVECGMSWFPLLFLDYDIIVYHNLLLFHRTQSFC
jgi:hypothetical protein